MTETMYKIDYEHYNNDEQVSEQKVAYVSNKLDIFKYRDKILKVTPMEVDWYLPLTSEEIQQINEEGKREQQKQRIQQQIDSKQNDLNKLQKELEKLE